MKNRNKSRNKKTKIAKLQGPIQSNPIQQTGSVEGVNSMQSTVRKDANIPYIETGRRLGRHESQLVEFFMEDPEATIWPMPSIECVTAFCSPRHLRDLRNGSQRRYLEKVALIDDWIDDKSGRWNSLGPLNEQELYVELLKKVRISVQFVKKFILSFHRHG